MPQAPTHRGAATHTHTVYRHASHTSHQVLHNTTPAGRALAHQVHPQHHVQQQAITTHNHSKHRESPLSPSRTDPHTTSHVRQSQPSVWLARVPADHTQFPPQQRHHHTQHHKHHTATHSPTVLHRQSPPYAPAPVHPMTSPTTHTTQRAASRSHKGTTRTPRQPHTRSLCAHPSPGSNSNRPGTIHMAHTRATVPQYPHTHSTPPGTDPAHPQNCTASPHTPPTRSPTRSSKPHQHPSSPHASTARPRPPAQHRPSSSHSTHSQPKQAHSHTGNITHQSPATPPTHPTMPTQHDAHMSPRSQHTTYQPHQPFNPHPIGQSQPTQTHPIITTRASSHKVHPSATHGPTMRQSGTGSSPHHCQFTSTRAGSTS